MYGSSLRKIAYNHIKSRYPDWVHKGELGRLAINEWGFESENLGRRCRELVNEGRIEVRYTTAKSGARCAEYRWKPPQEVPREQYERELLIQASR